MFYAITTKILFMLVFVAGVEAQSFPLCSQTLTLKKSLAVKCLNISLPPQLRNRRAILRHVSRPILMP
jgi:hypothetical protein